MSGDGARDGAAARARAGARGDPEDSSDGSLIALIDSLNRLQGRLSSAFAPARPAGLSPMELTVLNAVTGAASPPTVPRIGRALGHPRQVIQRAANALLSAGLIETRPNPDHRRASLLVSTPRGAEVKAHADARAAAIERELRSAIVPVTARDAIRMLDELRAQLDDHARSAESPASFPDVSTRTRHHNDGSAA